MRQAVSLEPHPDKQHEAEAEMALYLGDYARCRELTAGLDPFLTTGGSYSAASVARACAVRQGDYAGALALLQPELARITAGKGDVLGYTSPALEEAILFGLLNRPKDAEPLLESARSAAQTAINGGNENWRNWRRLAAVQRLSGQVEDSYRSLTDAFAHGMTINPRIDGDLEFLPFRDDARFAELRKTSQVHMAEMRESVEKMLRGDGLSNVPSEPKTSGL